ncbi:MAG: hypothetical protein Q9214_002879, partial [Letrouitia sp. 1 TL-2023]
MAICTDSLLRCLLPLFQLGSALVCSTRSCIYISNWSYQNTSLDSFILFSAGTFRNEGAIDHFSRKLEAPHSTRKERNASPKLREKRRPPPEQLPRDIIPVRASAVGIPLLHPQPKPPHLLRPWLPGALRPRAPTVLQGPELPQPSRRSRADYHAIALVTRNPRSLNTKGAGARCVRFRPHTARCLCGSAQPGQIETKVFNRLLPLPTTTSTPTVPPRGQTDANQRARHAHMHTHTHSSKAEDYDQPCTRYDRQSAKGQFETWSWFKDSCIPLQAPKMVHIDSLHLIRPLTQRKFGLRVAEPDVRRLEASFLKFRSGSSGGEREVA